MTSNKEIYETLKHVSSRTVPKELAVPFKIEPPTEADVGGDAGIYSKILKKSFAGGAVGAGVGGMIAAMATKKRPGTLLSARMRDITNASIRGAHLGAHAGLHAGIAHQAAKDIQKDKRLSKPVLALGAVSALMHAKQFKLHKNHAYAGVRSKPLYSTRRAAQETVIETARQLPQLGVAAVAVEKAYKTLKERNFANKGVLIEKKPSIFNRSLAASHEVNRLKSAVHNKPVRGY